jgi:transcriptional regulator with XRE-family HTH domain
MNDTLALLVKRHRKAMNLSQTELARRAGIAQGVISRIETGAYKEVPPVDVLEGLARELKLSQAEMLEALGYTVRDRPLPRDDADTLPGFSRLTMQQRAAIMQLIEAVAAHRDALDPPDEDDDEAEQVG